MRDILAGLRVVTLAVNLPGPLAAAWLTERGAAVTKIEPPVGDPLAVAAPDWYAELTHKQQVVVLDLKDPHERDKLDIALASADVLLTAMRPSALRRIGLENAQTKFPGLSHVEIVGHDGDLEERPGHDLTYQAAYGTLQPPLMPTVPVADLLGAERAVSAVLLSILERSNSTAGHCYRVVLEEAAYDAGAAVRYGLTGPGDPLGGAIPTYQIYECADGYVALGALEPHFRARTLQALGNVADTHHALARVFASKNTAYWEALAERVDIPITGIRTPHRGVVK